MRVRLGYTANHSTSLTPHNVLRLQIARRLPPRYTSARGAASPLPESFAPMASHGPYDKATARQQVLLKHLKPVRFECMRLPPLPVPGCGGAAWRVLGNWLHPQAPCGGAETDSSHFHRSRRIPRHPLTCSRCRCVRVGGRSPPHVARAISQFALGLMPARPEKVPSPFCPASRRLPRALPATRLPTRANRRAWTTW